MARADFAAGTRPIGRWRFDETSGTLSDGDTVRRLEFRAAATLAVLCRRRGEVVGRQELLDTVWGGRAVSANSVAVVIADLRRAMGDHAKAPTLLLTVAKRGYRLVEAPEPVTAWRRRGRSALLAVGGGVALLAAGIGWTSLRHRPVEQLAMNPIRNDTGLTSDGPLASALGALVVDELARDRTLTVAAAAPATGGDAPPLMLSSRLVRWNGIPTLHLLVTRRGDDRIVWSAMVVADADHIAAGTIARITALRQWLRAHPGGA